MTNDDKRNPGAPVAVAAGCICPRIDNCNGRGRGCDGEKFGWVVRQDCPVHKEDSDGTEKR